MLSVILLQPVVAAEPKAAAPSDPTRTSTNILTPAEWRRLDEAVDRGLLFLASRHRADGSFETLDQGQPGVTSLCVMAFLSRGHLPGQGPYGPRLSRAIDYALSMQQASGLFWTQEYRLGQRGGVGIYNHGIAGLMLTEVYGMTDARQQERIRAAIPKAIALTRHYQLGPKTNPADKGGWRYLNMRRYRNSDVSSTSWQVMFLRSARNAEFDVPKQYIDQAVTYVKRSFKQRKRVFEYPLHGRDYVSAGVMGGGIVTLALGGEHQSKIARHAGDWVLSHNFNDYNRTRHRYERYHYSAFYCSQAMFQLGGEYWAEFYPRLMRTLIANQNSDGSWQPEGQKDANFGNTYTSALAILALTPPYQLLPIYQR
jgi:hypothetical protein